MNSESRPNDLRKPSIRRRRSSRLPSVPRTPLTGATLDKSRTPRRAVATAVSGPSDGADVGGRIDIVIERWSTDANARRAARTARERSETLLLGLGRRFIAMASCSCGADALGARAHLRRVRNLKYAQKIDTPTGRQIVVVADQHLGFGESGRDFKSWQPEFGLLEIRIGADGTGVGKLAHADKIAFNPKTHVLELADFASEPVRLAGVRSEKN